MARNLSKNFTVEELTISQEAARSGLKNTPNELQLENLRLLCVHVLQPLRERVNKSIVISSGFRSQTINRRIGGSNASQHTKGQAADFIVPGMAVSDVIEIIRKMKLPVDQCIDEFYEWVHVSYGPRNRKEFLKARRDGGVVVYKK